MRDEMPRFSDEQAEKWAKQRRDEEAMCMSFLMDVLNFTRKNAEYVVKDSHIYSFKDFVQYYNVMIHNRNEVSGA